MEKTERNFDKLQDGHWYLNRRGSIIHVHATNDDSPYKWKDTDDGRYVDCGDFIKGFKDTTCFDLVTEITEPSFTVVKRKKKVKKYKVLYTTSGISFMSGRYYESIEAFLKTNETYVPIRILDFPETTIEVEVDDD